MRVQETALVVSTAVSFPLAALYSVARWDAARYALTPNRQSVPEQSQSDDKNQKVRGIVVLIGGMVFILFCGLMGWYSRYLPPTIADLASIILLSAVPANACLTMGLLLTGTAHEEFSRNEQGVLDRITVKRTLAYRLLAISVFASIPICNYVGAPQFPLMVTLGIGSMFLPSLLMGSNPTDRSPPLRSLIKVETIKGACVVLLSILLPKFMDMVASRSNEEDPRPPRIPSAFAPWKDRTEAMYALFLPAMQVGMLLGALLSRLYRIDMANYRRKNPAVELQRDSMPGYLLETEPKIAPKVATEDDAEEGTKMERSTAIRVLSMPEAITTNMVRHLLCPSWYFAAGFLTMLLLLVFAMPALVYHSPIVKAMKEELSKSPAGLVIDDSAWLSSNVMMAMYGALHMVLLSLPILLSVAVVAFVRGESDFVWNYRAEWKPFCMDETPGVSESTRADEKTVAAMLTGVREEEERLI